MSKIYGVIPVGGQGSRLGLPFPKEMLPMAGLDHYEPIMNNTVHHMINAGVNNIYMIHGRELKQDIVNYYSTKYYSINIHHWQQEKPSFGGVVFEALSPSFGDTMLVGMPDTIINGLTNPFLDLLMDNSPNSIGVFRTSKDKLKVDRITNYVSDTDFKLDIKTERNGTNSQYFWGILKLDVMTLFRYIMKHVNYPEELGTLINSMSNKSLVHLSNHSYIDLGTWPNLNEYWRKS